MASARAAQVVPESETHGLHGDDTLQKVPTNVPAQTDPPAVRLCEHRLHLDAPANDALPETPRIHPTHALHPSQGTAAPALGVPLLPFNNQTHANELP